VLSEELLERVSERAAVARALDDTIAGRGRLLLFEGEAGIGKTALLDLAMQLAAQRGLTALHARGGALEEGFGYGIVRQLFESTLLDATASRRRELLSGPAALSAPVFGLPGPRADAAPRPPGSTWRRCISARSPFRSTPRRAPRGSST
jgi:AAA ATPase domain